MHAYEATPRRDHRGVDLISDALPLCWLCMANLVPPRMQSAMRSIAVDHVKLSFAFTMMLAT
jgi:hypothetical protein